MSALALSEITAIVEHASRYFMDRLYPLQVRMDDEDWFPESDFRALGGMGLLGCGERLMANAKPWLQYYDAGAKNWTPRHQDMLSAFLGSCAPEPAPR